MALKNLTREKTLRNGLPSWRLCTLDGREVEAFSRFAELAHRYKPRTTKRYLEVVGRFLDYLFEAGVFGTPPLSVRRLNAVIDAYPQLLRDGSELTARRILTCQHGTHDDHWLADTALGLGWTPLATGSFSNTLAGINHFLSLSEALAREELERAHIWGIDHKGQLEVLIQALQGNVTLSTIEVHRMRQNSMLGSVAKYASTGIHRNRRLSADAARTQEDLENKAFPLESLSALIEAATSWRDKSLWLLLAASGIRTSEARNLLLQDVLPDEQKVYVFDPNNRHFKPAANVLEQARFKGRAMAATYLFPPLRQQFFEALEKYLLYEYVPVGKFGEAQYLFQYVEPTRRGQPLVNASDSALAKSFKKAVHRAGIALPFDGSEYTPHSLRHLYGVYMLNDYPIDPSTNQFGLSITDVQMLMGHTQLSTTQKYARVKSIRLMQRLEKSDQSMLSLSPQELNVLPLAIVGNLEFNRD